MIHRAFLSGFVSERRDNLEGSSRFSFRFRLRDAIVYLEGSSGESPAVHFITDESDGSNGSKCARARVS
jgi:hypothetical protein